MLGAKLNYLPTQEMIKERQDFLTACKANDASNIFSFVNSKHINWHEGVETICNNGIEGNEELLLQIIHDKQLSKSFNMTFVITTVYRSSMSNKLNIIESLLTDKTIVSIVDMNALFICWVEDNDLDIIQHFSHLEPGNSEYLQTAINIICRSNYAELLKYFTTKHTIEQYIFNQGFVYACEFGHLRIVKHLLCECGADIHFNYDSGLRKAGKNSHLEVVQYLLNSDELIHHADPSAVNDDLSITAIMHNNYTLFNYLYKDYGLPLSDRVKEYKKFKNFQS